MSRDRSLFIERLLSETLPTLSPEGGLSWEEIPFRTVYFGGGTPSQLTSVQLSQLVEGLSHRFNLSQVEEWTIEMNPEDVTPAYVEALPSAITRVSMGVQSMVDSELQLLRRRHDAHRPAEAVRLLRNHGIRDISLDLMYGLPQQTLESFDYSIQQILELHPEHISAYCLSIEEDTPLDRMIRQGHSPFADGADCADDELCNAMNHLLRDRLSQAGYIQYEISNYALPGHHSRHNSAYWQAGLPYLGLGPGAHSYDGAHHRWWNEPDLAAYLSGQYLRGEEHLTDSDIYNERIMLGLRTRRGVDIEALRNDVPGFYTRHFLPTLSRLKGDGTLSIEKGTLHLTPQALSMADAIIREFMA